MSHSDAAIFKGGLSAFIRDAEIAIEVGAADRAAAATTRSNHEKRLSGSQRTAELQRVRVDSVMGQVPEKIAFAVGTSLLSETHVRVPVMELTHHEYPGPHRRSPFSMPRAELSPEKLCFAGKDVYDFLKLAGMEPELDYVFNGDIRCYSLQIVIKVAV